jgi:hypothetical protein
VELDTLTSIRFGRFCHARRGQAHGSQGWSSSWAGSWLSSWSVIYNYNVGYAHCRSFTMYSVVLLTPPWAHVLALQLECHIHTVLCVLACYVQLCNVRSTRSHHSLHARSSLINLSISFPPPSTTTFTPAEFVFQLEHLQLEIVCFCVLTSHR